MKKRPSIGDLHHSISIEQRTDSVKPSGAYSNSWSTVSTVWAAIAQASAREVDLAQRLEQRLTHHVVLRYDSALSLDSRNYRLNYNGRIFDIITVVDIDEAARFIALDVEESSS